MAFNAYMHKRNIYRNQPDFTQIALDYPEFRKYAIPDAKGQKVRVDFTNTEALRMLTKILLKKDFNLDVEIPQGFLVPTVPQRLNYILWVEDLLSKVSQEKECASGIDIGTGPCAIFSLLGAQKNGWKFIATESSDDAIQWAAENISKNNLLDKIRVIKVSKGSALEEILSADNESYDFCMCNPPFFENIEEIRKKHKYSKETIADVAQKEEIFVKGGELDFVKNILKDSLIYKDRISLFTSMFGKKKSLFEIVKEIQEIKNIKFTTTEFCQGNTVRWGIAWTFMESVCFEEELKKKRNKSKKAKKPPLEYEILLKPSVDVSLDIVLKQAKEFLALLEIPVTITKSSKHFAELLLKSDKNTWTHQRRKRRELERQKRKSNNSEEKPCSASSHKTDTTLYKSNNCKESISLPIISDEAPENTFSLQYKQKIFSDSPSSENGESNVSSQVNTSQTVKRKVDFSSKDTAVSKKAKPDENISKDDTKTCSNVPLESTHLDDHHNVGNIAMETDANADFCKTDCKCVLENHKSNALLSTSESDSMKLEPLNKVICGRDTIGHSEIEIYEQNPSSSTSECVFSSTDHHRHSPSENSSNSIKTELNQNNDSKQGLVLHCFLQFIKGKSKIFIKMKCPPTADRNTMHQVFSLIKNKITAKSFY